MRRLRGEMEMAAAARAVRGGGHPARPGARPRAARHAPRRSPPPTSRSATSSASTWRASGRRCRSSACATARSWPARASCSTGSPSPRPSSEHHPAVLRRSGRYVPRELLVPEARSPTASSSRQWLTRAPRDARAHPDAAARGEAAPPGARGQERRAGLRPRVEAPAAAVAGDPARAPGPPGPRGRAAAHRVLRHLEHPGLGHRGLHGRASRTRCRRSPTTASSR